MHSPEVFPRTDGTTYVCAISSESPLPVDPADVAPDPGAIERLRGHVQPPVAGAGARRRSSPARPAIRPVTQDGLPLIGRVPGVEGAYVATGHSVWGILNAPATGEAMAELIVDGEARTSTCRPSILAGWRRSIRTRLRLGWVVELAQIFPSAVRITSGVIGCVVTRARRGGARR